MKRIISLILVFILVFSLFVIPGYAATVSSVSASIDQVTRMVTVTGIINTGEGRQVSLKVAGPDGITENYVGQTESTENGSFTFTFKLAGNINGTYTAKVSGEFVTSVITATFQYSGGADAEPAPPPSPVPGAPASWTSLLMEKDKKGVWQFNQLNLSDKEWNIGKYDFSYAGYKYNDTAFGTGVPGQVATISAAQGEDITEKINTAISSLNKGGIVQIPSGEYRVGTKPPDPPAPPAVTVDNSDTEFSTGGTWTASNYGGTGFVGSDYLHDGAGSAEPEKWAMWRPNIPASGNYNIYMWWTASGNRPAAAPLEIKHSGGTDVTKTVNQMVNGSKWVLIGTYSLSQGTDNYVKILASSAGYTVADAVKFEPVVPPSEAPRVIVNKDNVVIRGAADGTTRLVVDSSYSSNDDYAKGVIQFGTGFSWKDATAANAAPFTNAVSDIMTGSTTFDVADATGFQVGDSINIRQKQWPEFNRRNFGGLTELLTHNSYAFHYLRKITAVNGNTITVDIPVAYDLKPGNNTIDVYKVDSFFIKNVGLEDLQIDIEANGDIETNPVNGAETKNTNSGTAVMFVGVWDAWAENVTLNNINTLGFGAVYSSEITFDHCSVNWGRTRGAGGKGYGFYIKAQNLLFRNCSAYEVRHGFTTAAPVTNNVVIKNSKSQNLGFYPTYQGEAVDDTHIAFTHGILWDNHYGDAAGIYMIYRGTLSDYAYETCGWGIVWNYYDTGRNPNNWSQGTLKLSPADYAYVVAPHGNVTVVDGFERAPSVDGKVETDPVLHVGEYDNKTLYEGIGWDNLAPESLHTVMYFKRHNIISPTDAPKVKRESETSANISWKSVSGADGYVLYRSTDGRNFTRLTSTSETSFEDSSLAAGTNYYYSFAPTYLYEIGEKSPAAALSKITTPTGNPSTWEPAPTPGSISAVKDAIQKGNSGEIAEAVRRVIENVSKVDDKDLQKTERLDSVSVEITRDVIAEKIKEVLETLQSLEKELKAAKQDDIAASMSKAMKIDLSASVQEEVKVALPVEAVEELRTNGLDIVIERKGAEIKIPSTALEVDEAAEADKNTWIEIVSKELKSQESTEYLNAAQKKETGNSKLGFAGKIFDFSAAVVDGDTRTIVKNFNGKVIVEMSYEETPTLNESKLGVYRYNPDIKAWDYVGGKVDKSNNKITFKTGHFSVYTIMEYNRTFDDIQSSWTKEAIEVMAAKHIISGVDENNFEPQRDITRAEFATMIIKALELDIVKYRNSFNDVSSGKWYADIIQTAADLGLVSGYAGNFRPEDQITREEMIVIVMKAYDYAGGKKNMVKDISKLTDMAQINSWALESVKDAVGLGIISGTNGSKIAPGENSTRAQAAAVIQKLLEKL